MVDPLTLGFAEFDQGVRERFQQPPPAPPPELQDAAAGRVADARALLALPDLDRSYPEGAREQARRLAESLVRDAPSLDHEQMVLRAAEIAALADNGHTAIGENALRKNTPRVPLRLAWFAEGLFVVQAAAAHRELLGARVLEIEGRKVEEVARALRRYCGGTDSHCRLSWTPALESPALLRAAGLAADRMHLALSGTTLQGAPFARTVEAVARGRSAWVASTARLYFPQAPGSLPDGMESLRVPSAATPVWLRESGKLFTLAPLPGSGLYLGLGACSDADDLRVVDFLAGALVEVGRLRPVYVVVDLRLNGGGDYTKTHPLAPALHAALGEQGRVYVLTSGFTFSAAIATAAALKTYQRIGSRVVLVGESPGDRLRFWSEGAALTLPNTFTEVAYATGAHDLQQGCADPAACFWLASLFPMRVASLEPEVPTALTFAAWSADRDPALEAVLAFEERERARAKP